MRKSEVMVDQASRLRELALRSCTSAVSAPHLICVTSGKGGVGKSTVTLNLGLALAAMGRRTLIVDADQNLGSLDVMVGASPVYRLGDVLRGERDLEEAFIGPSPLLKILAGSSGDPRYPHMTEERQRELLKGLRNLEEPFDYVFIDTGAGLSSEIIRYAEGADETIIVTTPDPTSVVDAYAVAKWITMVRPEAHISVIVNRASRPVDADDAVGRLSVAVGRFLSRSVVYLGSIPNDGRVPAALTERVPLLEAAPASAAALSIRALAQVIDAQRSHEPFLGTS